LTLIATLQNNVTSQQPACVFKNLALQRAGRDNQIIGFAPGIFR